MPHVRNYRIQGLDLNAAWRIDAERWGPDDWRWTSPDRAGMMISTRLGLAMILADLIAAGEVTAIAGPPPRIPFGQIVVNRLGGVVNDGVYWSFDALIESILPEEWEGE